MDYPGYETIEIAVGKKAPVHNIHRIGVYARQRTLQEHKMTAMESIHWSL